MNVKTRVVNGGTFFILTGVDTTNEIAVFPDFLRACLVARYLSGGDMPENDQKNALAAIAEYDELIEAGKIHHEAGGEQWAE